ncbi:hypothetical protein K439DRAFT_1255589, partial [Ramaria rubella]
ANCAIRTGLIIESKRVWARKLLQEPRRCLKCQGIGSDHIAAECKSIHDTCGTCGGMHRASECSIRDQASFQCANCKVKGPAAWDRQCPNFKNAAQRFRNRYPENAYCFFPTRDEPDSWE